MDASFPGSLGGFEACLEKDWIEVVDVIGRHWEGTVSNKDRYINKKVKGLLATVLADDEKAE